LGGSILTGVINRPILLNSAQYCTILPCNSPRRHCEAAERLAAAIHCKNYVLLFLLITERVNRNFHNGLPRLNATQPRNDGNEELGCLLEISLAILILGRPLQLLAMTTVVTRKPG
jgi:hypothetical protein